MKATRILTFISTPIVLILFFAGSLQAQPNYIVNSNTDANAVNLVTGDAGGGVITLRSAIQAANTQAGAHIITFSGAVVSPINISLGQIVVGNAALGNSITVTGPGMGSLTVNQTTGDQIFFTGSGAVTFILQDITLNYTGPAVAYSGGGGAIIAGGASAVTTLTNVAITNFNQQLGNGGAISASSSLNDHDLTITNCIFTNNRCGGGGGAVSFNSQGGTAIITGCTFTNNHTGPVGANTGGDGGAINLSGGGSGGTYLVEKNTFINNQAENPGGHAGAIMSTNGTATIRYNRFIGNTCLNVANPPLANVIGQAGGATIHTTIADNNWWGVNTGPGANDATALAAGAVMTLTKWLQLKTTASPNPICASSPSNLGHTSTVTTSFLSNSASEAIAVGNLTRVIGLPVVWGPTTLGSLSGQQGTIQASGTATALFTSNGTGGTATVNTQVDNVPAGEVSPSRASITVNTLSTPPTGATGTTTICYNTSTTLTVSGGFKGTAAVTQWYSGPCGTGLVNTGDVFITPALTTTTTYFVRYSGTCNTTTCATVVVTVLPQVNYGSMITPGVSHLVISQVYGGGGNTGAPYLNDFIEIFNPTASPVSVTGWSVQYAAATGTTWSVTNLSGSIDPGKYYLVQEASNAAVGSPLPSPDASGSIAMSATTGKVALVNSTVALSGSCPTTGVIDFVGYGTTADCFEGAGKAPAPSNTTSDLRASNGCTDTDNNASDFSTGAPNPRNSATPANLCSGTVVVCSGTIPASMSVTGGSGGTGVFTYQWYSKSGVICPTGTDISGWTALGGGDGAGFNTTTFTPSVAVTSDITFACVVTPAGSPVCPPPKWANGCRVIVVNNVTGGTVAGNQGVCTGGDPAAFTQSVASTGDGTLTYQWQSSTTDCSTGFADIIGETGITYDVPAGLTTETYYRRVTTSTLNAVACTANSNCLTVTINTLSTAPTGATGTTTICPGGSTTLTVDGGSKGTGAVTQWFTGSCGGTPAGTGDAITVSPTTTTTYYVRYSGTCNTTTCAEVTVTVNTLSTAPTGASGTTTICNGGSTTLTVTGGSKGTGAITEWFTGSCGGTPAGTGDAITVSPTSTTTYYVRYNGTCNTTTCATVIVTVNTLSTAPTGATGTTTICNGGSTTLTVDGGSKGTGAVTEWFTGSCGGTPAGTGDAVTVSPTSTTTYYVRYNGICNTTACATVTVTVNTLSTAPAGATGTTTICNGGSTTLTVDGGSKGTGAVTEWFTGGCGGTPAGTGDAVTVSPTSTTTYYVRYNGTCNTTACASVTVIVNTLSTAPTGATGTTTICNGGSTTLTVTGGSKGTGAITEWFTGSCGGTSAGTGDAISVSPTSTTTYYVRYNGTCNTTLCGTVIVTVNNAPVVTTNPVSQSVVPPNIVTFTAAATGSPTPTVQWQVSTGGPFADIPGETSTTLSFTTTAGQNGNQYRAVFTNTCGTATTTAATLTTCTTPVVTTNPASQAICAGNTVSFSAAASGTPTPTVQWQVSSGGPFTDIPGATSTMLSFTATFGQNGNQYRAVFTNACAPGGVNTTAATLTVNTAPVITCPSNISVNNTPGLCRANVTYPAATATGSPAPSITYSKASGTFFPVGTTTVTATATNICGSVTCSFTVTVVDNQPPVISCPANKTSASDAGLCTKTFTTAQIGSPTASDNCSYTISWSRSDAAPNLTDPFPFGITTITWTATDPAGLTASCNQTITIDKITTNTTVTVTPNPQQYSDKVTFVATVTPYNCAGAGFIGGTVTFKIGTLVMGSAPVLANGTATLANIALLEPSLDPGTPPNGPLKPGIKTVTAVYSGTDPDYIVSNPTTSLTITCEDARAYYTGACYASTSSPTSSNATVTLSATIKDISSTPDAAGDVSPGDIRNATVTFINRDNNTIIVANLPVGLVNPGDPTVGTATYNWNTTITGDAQQFTIGIIVNNYYCRNSSDDNTVVTVAKPLGDLFITGGGYLVLTNSAGIKAGTAGTKNNFGFNVKYNKAKTNLQGNINTIIRRLETDGIHVYQIKGTAMTSLVVNENCPKTAIFNGKANIKDITDPLFPVAIDGNATLQVKMTDMGEPGSSDKIAITVWNKDGGLWFASNWNGTTTVEQVLGGGNLKVHGGAACVPSVPVPAGKSGEVITVVPEKVIPETGRFEVIVYPNPSNIDFSIRVNSDSNEPVTVRILDVNGVLRSVRLINAKTNSIKVGSDLIGGTYIAEVIQGTNRKVVKLIKLN